jgi:hypothetical protein
MRGTLFWLVLNAGVVPFGIGAHTSPWLIALNAFVAGGLFTVLVAEFRELERR